MTKQKIRDWGRHLLLVLLLVSAALLLRHTGYYAGIREKLRLPATEMNAETAAEQNASRRSAVTVQPMAAMVCGQEGGERYGAAWESDTAAVLRRFSADLGEALGSAGTPVEMTEEAFRENLRRCGVFLQLYCPQPLGLLSVWLGAEMSGDAAAMTTDKLCLCASESEIALCFVTPDREFYSCTTAVLTDALRNKTAEFTPNGACFAWESDRVDGADYTVLLPSPPKVPAVKSAVDLPSGSDAGALLQAMGMNSYVASSYTEADGTVVYVEEESTLRVNPNGEAVFRRTALPDSNEASDFALSVGSAWAAAERSVGRSAGDGALLFAGAQEHPAQRTVTVVLDYHVNGVPVCLADGHAAELVMRGDTVIQARLQFRRFSVTEERTALLPFLQATAIAAAQQGRPELVYAESGDGAEGVWVVADE